MMEHQKPPAWLEDDSAHAPLSPTSSSSSNHQIKAGQQGISTASKSSPVDILPPVLARQLTPPVVRNILKFVTMGLCVLMFATACLGLGTVSGANQAGKVFVATYMLFFSVLLFLFEAIQIRNITWLDHMFQRNVGFLYSVVGKAFFIIFIAFLSFGLGDPYTLTMATGLSMSAFGALQVGLFLKYPEWFDDVSSAGAGAGVGAGAGAGASVGGSGVVGMTGANV